MQVGERVLYSVTLLRVSHRRVDAVAKELFEATQFLERSVRQQWKHDGANRPGQLARGHGITHDGGGLLQTALPSGLPRVAKHERIRVKAGSDQHGASHLEKVWPARGDAHQSAGRGWQPFRERGRNRANA